MTAIKNWSTTAGSNDAAAPDGFAEGMAPSDLNDGIRELMAQLRSFYANIEWRETGDATGTNDCHTVVYGSATTFTTTSEDTTAIYHAGRRIRAVGSSTGTIYGIITASTFSTNTTVTVVWQGGGSLSNESLTISVGTSLTGSPISSRTVSVWELGATGDNATDDSVAIQAAIDYAKGTYDSTAGEYTVKLDFGGQNFRVETSIDATEIRQPGFTMQNGGLYGVMSGGIVLDLAGTNSCILQDFRIYGDKTTTPDVGILQARGTSASFPAAGSHKFFNVQCNGFYNKSAIINFASEVSSYYGCRFTNRSRSLTAYAYTNVANATTMDTYFSAGVTSAYTTIPAAGDGTKSNICHYHAQAQIQRPADVNLTITGISKANPAVVTLDSGELTTAAMSNGDKIWIYSIAGMTELQYGVYTIANINNGAGTFELSGIDSTSYGTFTSGTFQNQTGPAMLLGGSINMKIADGSYLLTYGSTLIDIDTTQGEGCRELEFSFQAEHSPPSIINWIRAGTAGAFIAQQIKLELLNASQVNVDDIMHVTETNSGTIRINNLELDVTTMGTAPTNGVFGDATEFDLRNARIRIPLAAAMNTIGDFINFTGEVFSSDGVAVRTIHGLDALIMRESSTAGTSTGNIRFNNNSWYWYNDTDSAERRFQVQNTGTTAHFNDISDPLNTEDKYAGKMAYNISTNKPVWADSGGAGDVWVDATGATAHTPA